MTVRCLKLADFPVLGRFNGKMMINNCSRGTYANFRHVYFFHSYKWDDDFYWLWMVTPKADENVYLVGATLDISTRPHCLVMSTKKSGEVWKISVILALAREQTRFCAPIATHAMNEYELSGETCYLARAITQQGRTRSEKYPNLLFALHEINWTCTLPTYRFK